MIIDGFGKIETVGLQNVQQYMDRWHIAGSNFGIALCGAQPGGRYWAARGSLEAIIVEARCDQCLSLVGAPLPRCLS